MKLLVRRMMLYGEFRNAYLLEYKQALKTYLSASGLKKQLDSITNYIGCNTTMFEYTNYISSITSVKTFIDTRTGIVEKQLKDMALWDTLPVTSYSPPDTATHHQSIENTVLIGDPYPNPFHDETTISISSEENQNVNIFVYDITGKIISNETVSLLNEQHEVKIGKDLQRGLYLVKIQGTAYYKTFKLIKTL